MADNELGVTFTGDISDISAKLDQIEEQLNSLEDKTINLDINVDTSVLDQLNSQLDAVQDEIVDVEVEVKDEELQQLPSELDAVNDEIVDVNVEVEDTQLKELPAELDTIQDEEVSVNVHVDETELLALPGDAANAAAAMDEVASSADEVGSAIDSIDPTILNEAASSANSLGDGMGAAAVETDGASNATNGLGDSAVGAASAISGLSSSFTGFGGEIKSSINSISSFSDQMGLALSNVELLAVALAAVAAVAIGAYLADATAKAGEFNDSWARMGQAVGETTSSIDEVKSNWSDAISTMKDETGRSAGVIRTYITQMGIAGVESKDVIIEAFSGISGAAFVTGNSIDSIESAFRRVVSTGVLSSRQLMSFGITTDDVFKATGMTLDQVKDKFQTLDSTGRAALLAQILNFKYGTETNEAYKNSWEHLNDALSAAWNYLSIVIGQLILPIVIPAVEFLTSLLQGLASGIATVTGWFGQLNGSMGNTSTLLGGLSLLWGPLSMAMGPLGVVVGFIADNWERLTSDWEKFWTMIGSGDWGGALQLLVDELKWAFVDAPLAFLASLPGKIGELASTFLDIGHNIIKWIADGLTSLSDWLTEQLAAEFNTAGEGSGEAMKSGFGTWWDANYPKIIDIIARIIEIILPKLIDISIKATKLILKKLFDVLYDWMSDLPGNMYKWGQTAFQSFVDAIIDSIPGLRTALNLVKQLFPQSPPKTGPLADITTENMYDWMSSIMGSGMDATSNFNLNQAIIPTTNPISTTTNSTSIKLEVNLDGANISSSLDAEKIGQTVGKSAAEQFADNALNLGVSTIHYQRR